MSKKSEIPFDETIKVYLYFSNDGKLYAWTARKDEMMKFEAVRSMEKLHRRSKKLEDLEFRNFMSKYKDQQIISIPVQDGDDTIMICGTYEENAKLESFLEGIENKLIDLETYFTSISDSYSIDDDILDALGTLLSASDENQHKKKKGDYNKRYVRSYHIFYELFNDTFE